MARERRLPREALAPYLLDLPKGPLDFTATFGNPHPVEIEVGFGKGMFLVAAATARPDVNFLGIEIVRKLQFHTADRLARRELGNVRVACHDALAVLRDHVPTSSTATVHVYFPDPWWKRRHRKRRVFTPEFAVQAERVLKPGGQLRIATDVEEYFGVITRLMAEHTHLTALPPEEPSAIQTSFERKARLQDRAIHRCQYQKTG